MQTTGAIRAKVLAILEERYPCGWVPTGTGAALAAEVGVSRQRVEAIIKALGWETRRLPTKVLYQCVCGRVQERAALCINCRYVELPCAECGQPVRKLASRMLYMLSRREYEGVPSYQGPVYCDRRCFGLTAGRMRAEQLRQERG